MLLVLVHVLLSEVPGQLPKSQPLLSSMSLHCSAKPAARADRKVRAVRGAAWTWARPSARTEARVVVRCMSAVGFGARELLDAAGARAGEKVRTRGGERS